MCFIMIEFNGYLTGAAKKCFIRRTVKYLQNTFLAAACLVFPAIILFAIRMRIWSILVGCLIVILAIVILPYLQVKTDKNKYVPKMIRIQDNIILYVSDKLTESKSVDDVKEVRDCGEYYILLFPFGKYSDKFVCQKELLTQGTLEAFEALFEGKIVKKTKAS